MRLFSMAKSFLRFVFHKQQMDADLDDEIRSTVELLADPKIREGMSPREARRAARIELGGVEQVKESVRSARTGACFEILMQDVRYGLRMLAKSPGLTFVIILTLALGIGANAAVFTVVDSLILRPLPVPKPEQIIVLATHQQGTRLPASNFSYAELVDFQKQTTSIFSGVLGYSPDSAGLSVGGNAEVITAGCVTGNYFSTLGLKPALGRLFLPGEGERPGEARTIVLAYSYWKRRFGGDPKVVGKQVKVNGKAATVIGVAPRGFRGTFSIMQMQAFLPLNLFMQGSELQRLLTDRRLRLLRVVARLKPGVSLTQAQSAVTVVAQRLARQYAATDKGVSVRVIPERFSRPSPDTATALPAILALFLLLAALILALACLNAGNILFARATVRHHEMAIRSALGAGRARLMRQVLTEAFLLALPGGVAGTLVGSWATGFVASTLPKTNPPYHFDFRLDGRVFVYCFVATLIAGFVAGMWPAWRAARTRLNAVLRKDGGVDVAGSSRHRLRSALVALQLAGSLILLIVAALFVRSLERTEHVPLGFDSAHLLSIVLDPHEIGYNQQRTNEFYRELLNGVRSTPGVQSASLAFDFPMSPFSFQAPIEIEGHPVPVGQQPPIVLSDQIDPGYFDTMRIPLLRGRTFAPSDDKSALPVAIVNQNMAQRFWPGADPIGKRFRTVGSQWVQIVGVAVNGKYMDLGEPPLPFFYVPLAQSSFTSLRSLEIRSAIPPKLLLREVQQQIRTLAPGLPLFDAETMQQTLRGSNGDFLFRFGATLAGAMGLLGLLLAAVGLYGVMAFAMTQRTHDIGIRMALGASRGDILKWAARQGLVIVAAGILVGLVGGWALTHAMSRFSAGPSAAGSTIYGGTTFTLICVALAACYIPARRAMRVDPAVALRHE